MVGVDSWSVVPLTNGTVDGGAASWVEGMAPSQVNNSVRQMLTDIRNAFNDLAWFQFGTGDQGAGNLAVPALYASGTSFTIAGANVTAVYHANRRVRAVGSVTGTIYGFILSSSYNSGNSTTTVNVTWDSGSLSNETLVISISQIPFNGMPIPFQVLTPQQFGAVADAADDGTGTDNTTALTNWLTALGTGSSGSPIVGPGIGFLPAGKYKYTSTLTIPASATVYGVSQKSILMPSDGLAAYAVIQANGSVLRDIVIDGYRTGGKIGLSIGVGGLVSNGQTRSVISRRFINAGNGFALNVATGVLWSFEDCYFGDSIFGANIVDSGAGTPT